MSDVALITNQYCCLTFVAGNTATLLEIYEVLEITGTVCSLEDDAAYCSVEFYC